MRIGADYYPEHWEKERWKTDAEMMVKANIKVIRIGEILHGAFMSLKKENTNLTGWMRHWIFSESTESR